MVPRFFICLLMGSYFIVVLVFCAKYFYFYLFVCAEFYLFICCVVLYGAEFYYYLSLPF